MAEVIRVCAVALRDEAGRFLLVRKRGTSTFMQPGGKPEPGESPRQTAVREVREELGIDLDQRNLELLGEFSAPAANEPGHVVEATCFLHPWPGIPVSPSAEIDEIWFYDVSRAPEHRLAPLFEHQILPALGLRVARC